MRIPVFVSCPTQLNPNQQASRRTLLAELERYDLEPRAVGRSDYPTLLPLREVLILATHCSGAVILGFEQFLATKGMSKRGIKQSERKLEEAKGFPSPWNNLEAGVLFGLGLPMVVFREEGIEGGVFDHGVTDVFVHKMPRRGMPAAERRALSAVMLKWQAGVRRRYYGRP